MELRRQLLTTSALSVMVASAFMPHAHANPIDGVVSAGSADITANGKTLDITQHSDKAIIDWRGFDIAHDETTNFYQPSSSSIIVNRVHSSQASQIDGRLNANGNVIIINQNGLVFGAGAVVDVHGLAVSTSDLDNTDFMTNAPVRFTQPGNVDASIVNHGTITAHDAGLVGFVAPHVENHGVITANLGRVHLATGDKATVDFYGDGLMEVEASDQLQNQILTNTGSITADGGKIALSASAGGEVVNSIINAQGTIRAQSVGVRNGEIVIGAKKTGKSKVNVAGNVDASSNTGKGGTITVTADHIALTSTANLNASGLTGGGTIRIGGDRHGQGPTPNAKTLTVEQGSYIANNALDLGDGGETVLWSDLVTYFAGNISGTGGTNGGNGGFVEVSGKDHLEYQGFVDLSANDGYDFGNLLLDPSDIIISSGGDTGGSFTSGTYTASAGASIINTATLQSQITAANVTISTAGGTGGNGDITFANAVSFTTSSRTLTLNADRDIVFNASAGWTAGNSGFNMTAARDILFNANVTANGSGSVLAQAARDITIASGVTVKAGATGAMNMKAAGGVIAASGVFTNNGVISVGSGAVTLTSGLGQDAQTTRNDLTLTTGNFLYSGATVGTMNVSGFRDITVNRDITGGGAFSITAERDLAFNANVSSGAGNSSIFRAAGGVVTNRGVFTRTGTISVGAGSLTLLSGKDALGESVDLDLTGSNFIVQGAGMTSAVSVTGFRDINVDRAFTSTSSITFTADRNLTLTSNAVLTTGSTGSLQLRAAGGVIANTGLLTMGGTLNAGSGSLTLTSGQDTLGGRNDLTLNSSNLSILGANLGTTVITGFRDVAINRNLTSGISIAISAEGNLTIGSGITVATGAVGGMTLRASTTAGINGTGVLTNNGTVSAGAGTFVLLSGLDTFGERVDVNLNNTTWASQGASHTGINFSGFRDITVNRDFTTTGSITMAAERHFTNNANLISGAASSMILKAASTSVANIGLWSNTGTITAGSASLALQSGQDSLGNRTNLNLNNTPDLVFQGASFTGVSITGFGDVVVNRDITATGSITIAAEGSITNNAVVTTGAAGALSFRAATSSVAKVGTWTNNGTLSVGTGTLTISAGADGSGGRQDLVLNNGFVTRQGANFGSFTAVGFRDITLNMDILSAGSVNLTAERNLTVNSAVTTSLTGALHLRAAGALTTNQGILTLNAPISTGSSTLVLLTGLDTSGNATTDLVVNNALLTTQNATVGSVNFSGFRDISIDRALNSTGSVTMTSARDLNVNAPITSSTTANLTYTAGRDLVIGASQTLTNTTSTADIVFLAGRHLTVNSGAVIKSGLIGATSIRAANAVLTNQGVLTINGTIDASTGSTTLLSGLDLSGNRTADFMLSNATMTYQDAVQGAVSITGFRDVTVARNLMSGSTNITAERNLTINPGVSLTATTTGTLTFRAAGGASANTGTLIFSGATISVGTGALTLISGMDESGNRTDLTLDNSNLTFQGANMAALSLGGFRDINLARDITIGGSSTITAERNLNVVTGATLTTNINTLNLRAAGNNVNNIGALTINGNITTGAASITLVSGLNADGTRNDLTLSNSNFTLSGANMNALNITGFRDVTFARSVMFNGTLTVVAERNVNVSSGANLTYGGTNINMTLRAGGATSVNEGAVNIDGVLTAGTTGTLTLATGTDSAGVRTQDLVLDSAHHAMTGSEIGRMSITGYRDITFASDFTFGSILSVIAERNLTVNSGVTLTSGPTQSFLLRAGGASATNIGALTLNGKINVGSGGTFTLGSGFDNSGLLRSADLVLNSSNFSMLGASAGALSIAGFRDVTLNTDFISSGTLNIVADRNLTIGSGVTLANSATGSMTLAAGGTDGAGTGILTNNGTVRVAGALFAQSGTNSLDAGADFVWDGVHYSMLNSSLSGGVTVKGFRDAIFSANISSTGHSDITAQRDVIIDSGVTYNVLGNSNFSAVAANNLTQNRGQFINNGTLVMGGTGSISLSSGKDAGGLAGDFIWDNSGRYVTPNANISAMYLAGFRDITIARDITATSHVYLKADRNVTIASGTTVQAGATTKLVAANSDVNAEGVIRVDGTLQYGGAGELTFRSGVDATGNRVDLDLGSSHFVKNAGAGYSEVEIKGFRDVIIPVSLSSASTILLEAYRKLTLDAGLTLSSATGTTVYAKESFVNNAGADVFGGAGRWLIYSTSPQNIVNSGLSYGFQAFGCAYGASCAGLPGSGSGFIYTISDASNAAAEIRNNADGGLPGTFVRASQNASANTASFSSNISMGPSSFIISMAPSASGYAQTDYMLTFSHGLAQRYDLEDWVF